MATPLAAVTHSPPPPSTSGRGLARNTIWNLAGQSAPLAVAILTIPLLIGGLGTDRFGVLNLAWVVIGYFGLFDLGLGRAVTKVIAEKLGAGHEQEIPALFWTALAFMLLLGVGGTVVGLALSPWLVNHLLTIPATLQRETLLAFYLLTLVLPADMTTAALRGALEAKHRFDLTSLMRIATGLYTYVAPLVVILLFSPSLIVVVAVLVVGRFAAWGVHLVLCLRAIPALREGVILRRAVLGPLLRLGGWMNVSGVIYPLMVTLDRFLIGSLVSVAAVAYYATPYEVVTKLWVLPTAVAGVLFPAFAASFTPDRDRAVHLFSTGVRSIFLCIVPIVLVIVTFAPDGLTLWLGSDFAQHSGRVLQLLALGVCANSLSNVPFALIQGAGRADLIAKLHLVELPLYVAAVWLMARHYGIVGVALIWLVRGVLDTLALFGIAHWLMHLRILPVRTPMLAVAVALLTTATALYPADPLVKAVFLVPALVTFAVMGWFWVLAANDRAFVLRQLTIPRRRLTPHPPNLH